MKALVLTVALLLMAAQAPLPSRPVLAQSDDQAPGAPPTQEPPEYPVGEFCRREADVRSATDHPCHCRDMEKCTAPDEGQGTGPRENNQCKQWCHKDHCRCAVKCE